MLASNLDGQSAASKLNPTLTGSISTRSSQSSTTEHKDHKKSFARCSQDSVTAPRKSSKSSLSSSTSEKTQSQSGSQSSGVSQGELVCEKCSKKCKNKGGLKSHMKIHK